MPHYDRHSRVNESFSSSERGESDSIFDDDRDVLGDAAQALREVEVEAVRPAKRAGKEHDFSSLSIEDLHTFAAKLNVPTREAMTQRAQLIAAIRAHL